VHKKAQYPTGSSFVAYFPLARFVSLSQQRVHITFPSQLFGTE